MKLILICKNFQKENNLFDQNKDCSTILSLDNNNNFGIFCKSSPISCNVR